MIRELTSEDAQAYVTLRRAALQEVPLAFASSPQDDFVQSADVVCAQLRDTPNATIFGAFQPKLVGAVGIYRDRHLKSSHKAHIWGMYVVPDYRRQGIALEMIQAILRHATTIHGVSWVYLSVSSASPEAHALYERVGFQVWGSEPAALQYDGHTAVEYHMALCLE